MTRWKKNFIVVAATFSAVAAIVLCFKIWLHGFAQPQILVLNCPARPQSQLRLVKSGFTDREFFLYVSPSPRDETVPVTSLDFDGLYSFEELRWSEDGLLAVITIRLAKGDRVSPFAFDFSTMKAILPDWQDSSSTGFKSSAEWKNSENEVLELAGEHGGLTGSALSSQELSANLRDLHWWESP